MYIGIWLSDPAYGLSFKPTCTCMYIHVHSGCMYIDPYKSVALLVVLVLPYHL